MQYYTAISLFFWYLIPLCKPYLTLLLNDPCTESPSFDASLDLCLASIFAFLMALFFSRELSWADELIAAISAATTSAALYKVIIPWFYEPFLYSNILECFVEFFFICNNIYIHIHMSFHCTYLKRFLFCQRFHFGLRRINQQIFIIKQFIHSNIYSRRDI